MVYRRPEDGAVPPKHVGVNKGLLLHLPGLILLVLYVNCVLKMHGINNVNII
jgi:hypothetical protein